MPVLNPLPVDQVIGKAGALRDLGMTLEELMHGLKDSKKRMGYARILLMSVRPDDIFVHFLTVREVIEFWPEVEVSLEQPRWDFWQWLVGEWQFWDEDREVSEEDPCIADEGNVSRWTLSHVSRFSPAGLLEIPVESYSADSLQERLVSTLCALYERFDVQLLADLRVCFDYGGQLPVALMEIPRRIGTFSPLHLGWRLHRMDIASRASQLDLMAILRLERFKRQLIRQILYLCRRELLFLETC